MLAELMSDTNKKYNLGNGLEQSLNFYVEQSPRIAQSLKSRYSVNLIS